MGTIDEALEAIGVDPDDLEPEVLAGLRDAANKPAQQLTRDDLAGMSPDEILKAATTGRLDNLTGRGR